MAALNHPSGNDLFSSMVSEFNNYSKENNLDIELSYIVHTMDNSSIQAIDVGTDIEYLLKKGSKKYDIFLYDVTYSSKYAPYLVDLKNYISSDHINLYSKGIIPRLCTHNDRWIGLTFFINYSTLYCNKILLDKYNEDIPKTWNEMINVGKKILKNEHENGNKDLIGYNGLFPVNDETLFHSAYEFIYSFRKTKDSKYPDYDSKEALDALNTLKKIKNELASDEIFQSTESYLMDKFFSGNILFFKFWMMPYNENMYKRIPLFGNNEGISGADIGATNFGINKFIENERINASAKFIEFVTSKKIQKRLLIEGGSYSAINSLYEDEDVCNVTDCELINSLQPTARHLDVIGDYDDYSLKFKNYFIQFLYESKTAKETLNKIINIVKIYEISFNPSEDVAGFILFLSLIIITFILLLSLGFLFIDKFKSYYNILSKDLWILFFIGLIISLGYIMTNYGKLTIVNCKIKTVILSFGNTLILTPILILLINNFPEPNTYHQWIIKNKYIFILIICIIDITLDFLVYVSSSYKIKTAYTSNENGKKYKYCKHKFSGFEILCSLILLTEKFVIIIHILILIFMEWNIVKTRNHIKLISSAIFFNILLIFMLYLFTENFKNYTIKYTISSIIVIINVISNYLFIYISGVFITLMKKEEEIDLYNIRKESTINSTSIFSYKTTSSDDKRRRSSIQVGITKMMNYHYKTESTINSIESSR